MISEPLRRRVKAIKDIAPTSEGPRLWHYTTGLAIARILSDSVIRQATADVPEGERPAVWFTYRQTWEPTCNKGILDPDGIRRTLTTTETADECKGLFRIEVAPEVAPHGWPDFVALSGIDKKAARNLAVAARGDRSNPADWRVSFEPIPRSMWRRIDAWDRGAWVLDYIP